MNLRKIIREEISRVFKEDTATVTTTASSGTGPAAGVNPAISGTLGNIEDTLTTDADNVAKMIKTQTVDTKNKDNEIKANILLKTKLDANAPHRKGLEREIPELQKDLAIRQKQLKDLQNTQKGILDAQAELKKQEQDLESQSSTGAASSKSSSSSSSTTVQSVLPSLPSPI